MTIKKFQKTIWDFYALHKREMPWRETRDAYRVLVSEIMLQQTQVDRVRGFYEKFIKRFPSFKTLADAKAGDVLAAWQGLGYNRRALALQKCAQKITADCKGKLPKDRVLLEGLPGIGKGTSGSLSAFVFNEPVVFIETNIRRVFIHFFFADRANVSDEEISPFIEKSLDMKNPREWYWALMDYGSHLAADLRAKKLKNPNLRSAHYVRQSKFSGSDREIRGKLLKLILKHKKILRKSLSEYFPESPDRMDRIADAMVKEGFVTQKKNYLEVA